MDAYLSEDKRASYNSLIFKNVSLKKNLVRMLRQLLRFKGEGGLFFFGVGGGKKLSV